MEIVETSPETSFNTLFIKNLPHILEIIFFSLDYKSFKACMEVNKTWRSLLSIPAYQEEMEKMLKEKIKNEDKVEYQVSVSKLWYKVDTVALGATAGIIPE